MGTEARGRLRADARDNRDRILEVARAAFARDGVDVPIRAVARAAGLGIATVYRHFPTKEALVAEAFAERMVSCRVIVEEGLAREDPWAGFEEVVERLMVVHALDRGLAQTFTSRTELEQERQRTLRLLLELMAAAKEAGRLRDDVAVDDLVLVLMANEGIRAETPERRTAAARRFAALVVRSFEVPEAREQ